MKNGEHTDSDDESESSQSGYDANTKTAAKASNQPEQLSLKQIVDSWNLNEKGLKRTKKKAREIKSSQSAVFEIVSKESLWRE